MLINKNIQPNYSTSQLVLPLDFVSFLKDDDPIFSFNKIMDTVALLDLDQEAHELGRIPYDFRMMCKLVVFSYMTGNYSLREMSAACVTDIRYHVLTGGSTPSHKVIGEFIKYRLGSNVKELNKRVILAIQNTDGLDLSISFIDGTKIQANANKYTFVWKKAVIKYLGRLQDRITAHIKEMNEYITIHHVKQFECKEAYQPEDIIKIVDWLMQVSKKEGIEYKEKASKKKHPMERFYNSFIEYEVKMLDYLEKIEICGDRNSYSKTDHDATFMHLKEDYYGGRNLFHAAYNVQIMVSDEYITHVGVYDTPGDTKIFIPMMESYQEMYGELPEKPVADAGYGSYDNYMYSMEKGMKLVQKFNLYSIEKSSKQKKKIFHKDNWYREEETGEYICPRWKRFQLQKEVQNETGRYLKINQIYSCGEGCIFCECHQECTKSIHGRTISVNTMLEEMKEEVRKNLGGEEGKELKNRRSVEVEGAFGIIKNNWNYDRIHRKGKENVEIEMNLIAIGFNLRKYHNKQQIKKQSKENN